MASVDLLEHVLRFRVRTYEVDENGHVNNAVYLQWAENLTADHAEACGFGREWSLARGSAWLVHRHEITFRQPAYRGDEVEGRVLVLALGGVRGRRRTTFRRPADGVELAEVVSDWVWVRMSESGSTSLCGTLGRRSPRTALGSATSSAAHQLPKALRPRT